MGESQPLLALVASEGSDVDWSYRPGGTEFSLRRRHGHGLSQTYPFGDDRRLEEEMAAVLNSGRVVFPSPPGEGALLQMLRLGPNKLAVHRRFPSGTLILRVIPSE